MMCFGPALQSSLGLVIRYTNTQLPSLSGTHTDPMDLSNTRFKRLTDEQRAYRRANGLCSYCGDAGHFAASCRKKGKTRANAASSLDNSKGEPSLQHHSSCLPKDESIANSTALYSATQAKKLIGRRPICNKASETAPRSVARSPSPIMRHSEITRSSRFSVLRRNAHLERVVPDLVSQGDSRPIEKTCHERYHSSHPLLLIDETLNRICYAKVFTRPHQRRWQRRLEKRWQLPMVKRK